MLQGWYTAKIFTRGLISISERPSSELSRCSLTKGLRLKR